MKDRSLVRKLEADFSHYYQADLRDLWRPGSGMTVRWVVAHLMELPDSSRIKKHFGGDKAVFDLKDHLIADVRDLLLVNNYFTAVAAMKEMKSSQQQKIARGMPKRPPRPGDEKEKPRMATSEELKMLFPPKAAARRIRQLQQRRG